MVYGQTFGWFARFRFCYFREVFNPSISEYLCAYKMLLAARLLQNTAKTIYKISLECGYGDFSEFTMAFKNKYGTSPEEFRLNSK